MRFLTAFLLCCVTTIAQADDYVVIVFDTSASMGERMTSGKTRMDTAQTALHSVLGSIPQSTKVGIISFNGWVYDLQTVDRVKLNAAIDSLKPYGGTPLYQYIALGATRLLQERNNQNNVGSYKLLVVTDGAAGDAALNSDGRFPNGAVKPGVLKDILNRGVVIDAIGLDLGQDHALAKQINGKYMRGDDGKSLTKAIAKSVAEVGFGGANDTSEEAFQEVADLPNDFVLSTLKGLTTFPNHPINSWLWSKPGFKRSRSFKLGQRKTARSSRVLSWPCNV